MADTTALQIVLPRQRGTVTVRTGGLHEDLDALHEGDPLWWGKDFVADRVRSMPPDTPHLMFIGELDGEPVADGFFIGKGAAQRGFALSGVYVLPRARRRGVGRAMTEVLADATASCGLPGFADSVHEQDEASLAAAARLGYEVVGHHRESLLDLDTLDEAVARASVDRAEADGVVLRPLPDDADETDWRRAYDIAIEAWRDAPDAEGSTDPLPYSVFRGFFPAPSYVLLAWVGDQAVGMTSVMDRVKDRALNTFFTGVRRDARGRGLSTALKAKHALQMRAAGQHRIYTQNMDQNAPILAANDRLGFTIEPGYYAVGRPLAPGEGA
jgi:RimJ/RimL family protein N-acetyltransferase